MHHKIPFQTHTYDSVMQLIWDQGYEDWGDCKGRAWCGTCQVKIKTTRQLPAKDSAERICLNQLPKQQKDSRLACQLLLNKTLHQQELAFLGDE